MHANEYFRLISPLHLIFPDADSLPPSECPFHCCHTGRYPFARARILIFGKRQIVSTIGSTETERLRKRALMVGGLDLCLISLRKLSACGMCGRDHRYPTKRSQCDRNNMQKYYSAKMHCNTLMVRVARQFCCTIGLRIQ